MNVNVNVIVANENGTVHGTGIVPGAGAETGAASASAVARGTTTTTTTGAALRVAASCAIGNARTATVIATGGAAAGTVGSGPGLELTMVPREESGAAGERCGESQHMAWLVLLRVLTIMRPWGVQLQLRDP